MAYDFKFPVVLSIQLHSLWGLGPKGTEYMTMARSRATLATTAHPPRPLLPPCSFLSTEWSSDFSQYQGATRPAPTFPALLPSPPSLHSVFLLQNPLGLKHTLHDAHHVPVLILTHIFPLPSFPFLSSAFSLQGRAQMLLSDHFLPHSPLINSSSFTQHLFHLSCSNAIRVSLSLDYKLPKGRDILVT